MIISDIYWKNFKSWGNNTQHLKLKTNEGELILLLGQNGAGKSSVLEIFDYSIFGSVRNKEGKKAILSTIPNRLNGDLWTNILFSIPNMNCSITRTMNPSKIDLLENNEPYKKASRRQERIEELTQFDYDSFKSFISMSINDFKNFMSLSAEDKRKLIDKLFSLEILNEIQKIIKQLRKLNDEERIASDREILTLSNNISSISESVDKILKNKELDHKNKVIELTTLLNSKKPEYVNLTKSLELINNDINSKKIESQKIYEQGVKLKSDLFVYNERISVYKSGKCPTCHTDLSNNLSINYLEEMEAASKKIEETIKELQSSYNEMKLFSSKLEKDKDELNTTFANLKAFLSTLKEQITVLNDYVLTEKKDESLEELKNTITLFENNKKNIEIKLSNIKSKDIIFEKAISVFGDRGVKQEIINRLIRPVNKFISENLHDLNIPFNVQLNDNFDAIVTHLGQEIDSETLSTGEAKKVNICIMLAYIKLIRTRKHINILFLDEVFASIDIEGIYSILNMFKKFSKEYKINIFMAHHAELAESCFDRIIKINKNIFSSMIDEPVIV